MLVDGEADCERSRFVERGIQQQAKLIENFNSENASLRPNIHALRRV